MRQMKSVLMITTVFQPFVLLYGCCVNQIDDIAMVNQSIHQPVPIKGGFNGNRFQLVAKRCQEFKRRLKIFFQYTC